MAPTQRKRQPEPPPLGRIEKEGKREGLLELI
ncbi:hypothetical protein COLO4_25388 [Corchorus olitorius]|uniref:Uncharacterized protein n=1 Tax=Corchorus olitorius TaxID=93759 RepID=A0A1R3I353_9ROSI|nr:hypothetical protein COLO4_25388 [Corchorus olitorius]